MVLCYAPRSFVYYEYSSSIGFREFVGANCTPGCCSGSSVDPFCSGVMLLRLGTIVGLWEKFGLFLLDIYVCVFFIFCFFYFYVVGMVVIIFDYFLMSRIFESSSLEQPAVDS